MAEWVFQSFDSDADKKISYRESKAILRKIYPKGTKFVEEDYQ